MYLLSMLTSRHPVSSADISNLFPGIEKLETVPVNNDITIAGTLLNYVFSRQPNHARRFASSAFDKRLAETLKEFQPDIVQLESVFLATYVETIRRHSKAVAVLRMHNIEYQIWERLSQEVKNPVKKWYLTNLAKRMRKFEVAAWKQFNLLLPITKDDAALVKFLYHYANMTIAPFGIDTDNIPEQHAEHWVGYHIGAMDWIPNVEAVKWFVSYVWPEVYRASPAFRFFFAGRNMPDSFHKDLPEGVWCEGEVEDANAFISDKKILIVPLRSGGGIRIKILEAMAAGKLVVSTGVGMQGIEAVSGEHFYVANSARQFAEVIKKILSDKPAAEKVAANGRRLVLTRYRQENIMNSVVAAIEGLL